MKEHQGFFALVDRNGTLLPNFLAVTNMKLTDMRLIREGNERVLSARLADAKFFFDEDRKTKLEDRLEKLKSVTFHQKVGDLFQRTMRIKAVAQYLAEQVGGNELVETAQRAAELSKTDLLTGIVGEFPALQGTMGGEYAKHDGEHPDVAHAISEQYLPRGMEGEIPRTPAGKILSLADRLDKVAAFFGVGVIPKGSEDPYALRRDALSIVRIIVEGDLRLDLVTTLDFVQARASQQITSSAGDLLKNNPMHFILERFRFYAATACNIREDIVASVSGNPLKLTARFVGDLQCMKAISAIAAQPEFDPLIIGFKRAHRLCEKEQWDRKPVDPALFGHQAEADLYQILQTANQQFTASMEQGDYGGALDVLVRMKEPIDAFFAGVMVNADDPAIRGNRLSLLKDVDEMFISFADFSQIMVQGS
jgi:glycyl-tRNA synthetase beta chain